MAGVRKAIEKGAKVTVANYDLRTALHTAAAEGKIPVVRRLVDEMGANVNAKDRWHGTPLDDATREGHKAVVEFLLAKGAVGGKMSWLPDDLRLLFNAVIEGHAESVMSLVRRKVDPNMADADKRTALHVACATGNLRLVKCLVEDCKVDVNAEDRMGGRPIDDCLRCGHRDVAEFMRSHGAQAGKAIVNTEAAAELCDAASRGDIQKLRNLRRQGVDVNVGDYDMRTAMHLAASEGILPVIQVLVHELGGNQNVTDRWGGTPLDDAVRSGHTDIQQWLEENHGVRGSNAMFDNDSDLLCDAASKGDCSIFRGMAKQQVDINAFNMDHRTALHIACAEGRLESVQCLVDELGADVNPTDRWGLTPLDDALFAGHEEIVNLLKSRKGVAGRRPVLNDDASFLIQAALTGNVAKLREFMETKDRRIDAANFDKRTALHVASSLGHVRFVKCVIEEFGGNVNAVDASGGTPLDDATEASHEEVMTILKTAGAVLKRPDGKEASATKRFTQRSQTDIAPSSVSTDVEQSVVNRPKTPSKAQALTATSIMVRLCCDGWAKSGSEVVDREVDKFEY